MAETVAQQICSALDGIRGKLVFEEDDDDLLERAVKLFQGTVLTFSELAAVKESFDNALFRTELHVDNVWFHSELQGAYERNNVQYMTDKERAMHLIDWVRYPRRTYVSLKHASPEIVFSALYTFMQIWNHPYGGIQRLQAIAPSVIAFCMQRICDDTVPQFLRQRCVHTLCSMRTIETAIALRDADAHAQDFIAECMSSPLPLVALFLTAQDEYDIFQTQLRLNQLQKDMEWCGYWSRHLQLYRDRRWLNEVFDDWKYDQDDSLLLGIEATVSHIEYLLRQKRQLQRGDRVYLRLPMQFIRLEAGMVGTIVEFGYAVAYVQWFTTGRTNTIDPMLLCKIGETIVQPEDEGGADEDSVFFKLTG